MPGSTQEWYQDTGQVILIRFCLVFMLRSCCVHVVFIVFMFYQDPFLMALHAGLWRLCSLPGMRSAKLFSTDSCRLLGLQIGPHKIGQVSK